MSEKDEGSIPTRIRIKLGSNPTVVGMPVRNQSDATADSDNSGDSESVSNPRARNPNSRKRRIESSSSSASDGERNPSSKSATTPAAAASAAPTACPPAQPKPQAANPKGKKPEDSKAAAIALAMKRASLVRVRMRRVTALLEVEPDLGLQLRVKASAFQRYLDEQLAERLARGDLPDDEDDRDGASSSGGRSVRRSTRRRARPTYFSYVDSSGEDNDDRNDGDFDAYQPATEEAGDASGSTVKKQRNRSSSKLQSKEPQQQQPSASDLQSGLTMAELQWSVFPCLRSSSVFEAYNYCRQHGLTMQLHSRQPPPMFDENVIAILLKTYQYQAWLNSAGFVDAAVGYSIEVGFLTETEKLYRGPKYAPAGQLPSNFFACGLCQDPNNIFEYFCDWEQHWFREHRALRRCACVFCDFTCDRVLGMLNHLYLFHPDQPVRMRAAGQYCLVPQAFWRTEQCRFLCPHCGWDADRGVGIRQHLEDCGSVFTASLCVLCNSSTDTAKVFINHVQQVHGPSARRQQLQQRRHESLSAVEIHRSADSEFICRVCKIRSPYLGLVDAHLQTHRFQLLVKCATCYQLVERDWHIIGRHYQTQHPDSSPETRAYIETPSYVILHSNGEYVCPYCNFSNSSVCEFNAHNCPRLRCALPSPAETKCSVCSVGFNTTITQEAIHSHLVNFHRICPVCARVENTEPGDPRDPGRNCGYCEQLLHLAKNVSDASACYTDKEMALFMQAKHHNIQQVPTQHLHLPNASMQKLASPDLFRGSRTNWQCRLCDTSFPDIDSFSKLFALSNHLIKKHRLVPLFACPKCCHRFSSEVLTTSHIQRCHQTKHLIPQYLVDESNFFRPVTVTTVASGGNLVDVGRPPNLGQTLHNRYKTQQDATAAAVPAAGPSSSASSGSGQRMRELAARPPPAGSVLAEAQELRYHCGKCRRKSYSFFNVEFHVKDSHPEVLVYVCPIAGCGSRFTDNDYRLHFDVTNGVHRSHELRAASAAHQANAGRTRYACALCWQFTTDSAMTVIQHCEAIHQSRFTHARCPVCSFLICAGHASLQAHLHSEHPALLPLVRDGTVPLTLEQDSGLIVAPVRLPAGPNCPAETVGLFTCKLCGAGADTAAGAAVHWAAEHQQEKPPFACPVCPRTWFSRRQDAETHLVEAHSAEPALAAAERSRAICDISGCKFNKVCQLADAVSHLRRYHADAIGDELTLACPLCSHMRMASVDLAEAHRRVDHAGVPPELMPMARLSGRTAKLMRIESTFEASSTDLASGSAPATETAVRTATPSAASAAAPAANTGAAPASATATASAAVTASASTRSKSAAAAPDELQPPELQPQVIAARPEPAPAALSAPQPRTEAEMLREIESRGLIFVPSCDIRLTEPLYPGCDPANPTQADLAEAFRVLRVLPPAAAGQAASFVTPTSGAQLFALPQGGGSGRVDQQAPTGQAVMHYPPGFFAAGGSGGGRQR